jgi:hypothetical protein
MRRGKYTNFDRLRGSILSSMMRIKELNHLFHGGEIHRIWIGNTLKWYWIDPNESANKSSIYHESHSSHYCLQYKTILLILDNLHVSIKISKQSRIDNAGTDVEKLPMILLDHLINEREWRYHNIGSNNVSLNNHLSVFYPGHGSLKSYICPSSHSMPRTACGHFFENMHRKIFPKIRQKS